MTTKLSTKGQIVKLGARDQWQIRLEREPIRGGQPGAIIDESGMLARSGLIIVQRPDEAFVVADVNLERAVHSRA